MPETPAVSLVQDDPGLQDGGDLREGSASSPTKQQGPTANVKPQTSARRLKANNFTLLRLVAASLVIISHGFELPSGLMAHDFAYDYTGHALSWYAVDAFFVISGYLIQISWLRTPSAWRFIQARLLRLIPGLLVMLAVSVFVLGIGFSSKSFLAFISSRGTFEYFFGCLSVVFVRYDLPGVFASNPVTAVNGSLWTLRYEVLCYATVLAAGIFSFAATPRFRRSLALGGAILCACILCVFDAFGLDSASGRLGNLYELFRLATCFQLGVLFSQIEDFVPLRFYACIVLSVLALAFIKSALFNVAVILALAYTTFWFAFAPNRWQSWLRTAPDYSYGIYIYAFPIQQALIYLNKNASHQFVIVVGYLITLLFAVASWHFVEKPALSFRRGRPATAPPT